MYLHDTLSIAVRVNRPKLEYSSEHAAYTQTPVVVLNYENAGRMMEGRAFMSSSAKPQVFDPHIMSLRGRIGAAVLHSRYDSKEITAKARTAFLTRFAREVDPDGLLPEAERIRRAGHARSAYFARLAYASAKARKRRKGDSTA